jgi:glycosyltransferase involved in cell wall biosynthesis
MEQRPTASDSKWKLEKEKLESLVNALKEENFVLGWQLKKASNLAEHTALQLEKRNAPLRGKIVAAARNRLLGIFRNKAAQKLARSISFVKTTRNDREFEIKILVHENALPIIRKVWVKIGKNRKTLKKEPFGFSLKFKVGAGVKFIQLFAQDFSGNVIALKESICWVSGKATPEKHTLSGKKWGILATQHTLFIAKSLEKRLNFHGFDATTISDTWHSDFSWDMYIVLCPQAFAFLPPPQKRICYQLEQSCCEESKARWFTGDYFQILEKSRVVLDYSQGNLPFLARNGIAFPKVYFLPVGNLERTQNRTKKYDVLFYGDLTDSPRRQKLLIEVAKHFSLKIANDSFGEEMEALIAESRVVLNLHYYDNGLLETTRINECLSLGTPVVSEDACDRADYPELEGAVFFFETGSAQAMIECLRKTMDNPPSPPAVASAVGKCENRFNFMFDRFLLAQKFLPPERLDALAGADFLEKPHVVLSLPETPKRRMQFQKNGFKDFAFFDGLRYSPGWIGCGLSYRFLAKSALHSQKIPLLVTEDDITVDSSFPKRWETVQNFLRANPHSWDLFSGLIIDLHADAKIQNVLVIDGVTLVFLDKMTGTQFVVYNQNALQLLSEWPYQNSTVESNTIDRYLESQKNLRVLTTFPYLVGHHETSDSTLWNFQNSKYNDMIAASQKHMGELIEKFNNIIKNKKIMQPKVSVIVPCYNVEPYLHRCMDSLVNQTLKDIEIICIDDKSTDNSLSILREYEKKDSRIKIIAQERNGGPALARNLALARMCGEYVCFMDPDDFYPDTLVLNDLYTAIRKNGAQIAGGSLSCYGKNEKSIKNNFEESVFAKDKWMRFEEYQFDYFYQRFMYSAKMLRENKLLFPNFRRYQDPPFFVECMAQAKTFYALKRETYAYCCGWKESTASPAGVIDCAKGIALELQICKKHGYEILGEKILERINDQWFVTLFERQIGNEAVKDALKVLTCNVENANKKIPRLMGLIAPKISLIIPVYNVEKYLVRCLDSAIGQTLEDIEIICVNDGSTDQSPRILQEYAQKDKRIILIDQKNAGLSAARNAGLRMAQAPFVAFLDSDDALLPETLEKSFAEISKTKADVLIFDVEAWTEDDTLRQQTDDKNEWLAKFQRKGGLYNFAGDFTTYNPISCNKIFRMEIIRKNNLRFPEGLIQEDNAWHFCYFSFVNKIAYLNQKFYRYNIRQNSIMTSQISTEKIFDILKIVCWIYDFLNEHDLYKKHSFAFQNFARERINALRWKIAQCPALLENPSLLASRDAKIREMEEYVALSPVSENRQGFGIQPLPKVRKHTNPRVPWHTHLYRAGVSLFVPCKKPWHTHIYRAWRALCKDTHYTIRPNVSISKRSVK